MKNKAVQDRYSIRTGHAPLPYFIDILVTLGKSPMEAVRSINYNAGSVPDNIFDLRRQVFGGIINKEDFKN